MYHKRLEDVVFYSSLDLINIIKLCLKYFVQGALLKWDVLFCVRTFLYHIHIKGNFPYACTSHDFIPICVTMIVFIYQYRVSRLIVEMKNNPASFIPGWLLIKSKSKIFYWRSMGTSHMFGISIFLKGIYSISGDFTRTPSWNLLRNLPLFSLTPWNFMFYFLEFLHTP